MSLDADVNGQQLELEACEMFGFGTGDWLIGSSLGDRVTLS
jgi:hypothetical protein